jgi:hypothetical protein
MTRLTARLTAPLTITGGRLMAALMRARFSAPRTETVQKPDPGSVAATTSPLIPATTMLTGSSAAATTGRQKATIVASTTAATVHGCRPNSAIAIPATGTRKMPRRTWRSTRTTTRRRTVKRIHMSPIVTRPGGRALWGRT